jgi:8-oxo-dGTP pyrophosphatase MutT (NUDIX family)
MATRNHRKLSEVVGDYTMAASRRNDAPGNIRAGRNVISSRTNVLTDEDAEISSAQKTTRIIVRRTDGKFLCVYDAEYSERIGLPGGRVEKGEKVEDGAVRELWEETGLIANELRLISVDYFMEKQVFLFLANSCDGELKSSHEGDVGWCSATTLATGFFGDYYLKIFKKLGYL